MQPSQRETVIKELKRIRATPSLTEIERMTGVSRQTLLNITNGRIPSETTVQRLAPVILHYAQPY